MKSVSSYVVTLNRLLLFWLSVRAVNLFIFYVAEHSSLHTEARLLVTHLCDTPNNRKISGALIDCNQARTLINSKSFVVTYAIEKTLRSIIVDCWLNASHGVSSLVQLLGLVTTLIFTSALCLQHMYLGAQRIRYAREAYGESLLESMGVTRRIQPLSVHASRRQVADFGDPDPVIREKFD